MTSEKRIEHDHIVNCREQMIESNASQVVFYEDNCFSTILNDYCLKSKTNTRVATTTTAKEMNYRRSMKGRDDYTVKNLLEILNGEWTVSQVMAILKLSNKDHDQFPFPVGNIKIPQNDAEAKYIIMRMGNVVVAWYLNSIEKHGVVSKLDKRILPVAVLGNTAISCISAQLAGAMDSIVKFYSNAVPQHRKAFDNIIR
eukprot:scaffold41913_cov54-Attheya_sp.AAC.1